MDHLQKARVKVIKYIKTGKITKEAGEIALSHVKKFATQGKMADVDVILEKIGAIKAGTTKKILSVNKKSNPYTQKRKPRSKTPLIVGVVLFVLVGVGLFFIISNTREKQAAHQRRIESQAEADAATRRGDDARSLDKVVGEDAVKEETSDKSEEEVKPDETADKKPKEESKEGAEEQSKEEEAATEKPKEEKKKYSVE